MPNIYELGQGAALTIQGEAYNIQGAIEFKQGTYYWKEYHLTNPAGKSFWLSVEKPQDTDRYMLSEELDKTFPLDEQLIYNEQLYQTIESGVASIENLWGDVDAQLGDKVDFCEYKAEDGSPLGISYEKWNDGTVEYSWGKYLTEADILAEGLDFSAEGARASVEELAKQLNILQDGQYLRIGKDRYFVRGKVVNQQNKYSWAEYELENQETRKRYWLSVEMDGNSLLVELSAEISYQSLQFADEQKQVVYNNKTFLRTEMGKANVVNFTIGDYDYNESFRFQDYQCRETRETLSITIWADEREASLGNLIPIEIITVEQEYKKLRITGKKKSSNKLFILLAIFIFMFLVDCKMKLDT